MDIQSPFEKLTPQQKNVLEELKQIVATWIPTLEQPEIDFLDELCYYRYACTWVIILTHGGNLNIFFIIHT